MPPVRYDPSYVVPPHNRSLVESIRELNGLGLSDRDIGARIGRAKDMIRYFRRLLGLPGNQWCKHRPFSPEEDEAIKSLVSQKNLITIARLLNRDRSSVLRRLEILGLTCTGTGTHGIPKKRRSDAGIPRPSRLAYSADYVERSGWPTDLPIICVAILNLLVDLGPLTRAAIIEALGLKAGFHSLLYFFPNKTRPGRSQKGSALKLLTDRGLIHRLSTKKQFLGNEPHVFLPTMKALAMVEARLSREGAHA